MLACGFFLLRSVRLSMAFYSKMGSILVLIHLFYNTCHCLEVKNLLLSHLKTRICNVYLDIFAIAGCQIHWVMRGRRHFAWHQLLFNLQTLSLVIYSSFSENTHLFVLLPHVPFHYCFWCVPLFAHFAFKFGLLSTSWCRQPTMSECHMLFLRLFRIETWRTAVAFIWLWK